MLRSVLQNSTLGFYIFASDSATPTSGKTGLTIATTLSKAGALANSVSPTIAEIGNGLYFVAPISAHRDTLGEIAWQFAATGAIIAPRLEKVVAVNDQTVAFGTLLAGSYTAPDNVNIGVAAAQSSLAATSAASTDSKLNTGRLSRIDRMPDVIAGQSGGIAIVGSAMALDSATLAALFADADVASLVASVTALFNEATDVPVQTIAAQAATATVSALLANGSIATLIADAAAGKLAAESSDNKLTTLSTNVTEARTVLLEKLPVSGRSASQEDIASIGSPSGNGQWLLTVNAKTAANEGVPGVVVKVQGSVVEATTNSFGVAKLRLNDGNYTLFNFPPRGFSMAESSTHQVNGADVAVNAVVTEVSLPESNTPDVCLVTVDCLTQYADRPNDVQVWAMPAKTIVQAGDAMLLDFKKYITTDGRAVLPLLRGEQYWIYCKFQDRGVSKLVTVADAGSMKVDMTGAA